MTSPSSHVVVCRPRARRMNVSLLLENAHQRKRARIQSTSASQSSTNSSSYASTTSLRGRILVTNPAAEASADSDSSDLTRSLSLASHDIEEWSRKSPGALSTYISSSLQDMAPGFDPFNCLPAPLNTLEERMLGLYLLVSPRTAFGFSLKLKPNLVEKNFAIGLLSPSTFHILLVRAARHQMSLHLYTNDKEKRALEVAALRHNGEALRLIRSLHDGTTSNDSEPASPDDLLAATLNMAMLHCRYGPDEAATIHLGATRRLVKQKGGPLHIENSDLEHTFLMYEGGRLRNDRPSLIWELSDLSTKLEQLNTFLAQLHDLWEQLSTPILMASLASGARSHLPYLRPTSILYHWLTHDTIGKETNVYKDVGEMNLQLSCIFILACVFVERRRHPEQALEYKTEVEKRVRAADLDQAEGYGAVNVAFIMQDTQCCLRSRAFRTIQWSVSGFVWVLRFIAVEKKVALKNWLVGFLLGRAVKPLVQFTSFDFSYAR